MRCLLLLMFFVSAVSAAQNETVRDPDRGLWVKLQVLTAGDTKEDKLKHLKAHGMSEDAALKIITYVSEGQKKLQEIGAQKMASRCARGAQLKASRDALADEVTASSNAVFAARTDLVRNLRTMLSADDQGRLDIALSHMGEPEFIDFDVAGKIRSGKIDNKAFVDDACTMGLKTRMLERS